MYGKCIVVDYNAVHKDKCINEFLKLKNCYLVGCCQIQPSSRQRPVSNTGFSRRPKRNEAQSVQAIIISLNIQV